MSEAARVNVVARTTEKQFFLKKKKKLATFSQANEQPNAMHRGHRAEAGPKGTDRGVSVQDKGERA